jgi:redox-sensing transcriptional repressor
MPGRSTSTSPVTVQTNSDSADAPLAASAKALASARIPAATVARLPLYHRVLDRLAANGVSTVSSEALAAAVGVTSAMIRKDLSYLGSYGTRGVGYDVSYLGYQITQDWPVAIVGVGNLGRALAHYGGLGNRGFRVVALLDVDDAVIGTDISTGAGLVRVRHLDDLEIVIGQTGARLGVVAVPADVAQAVADRLVDAGIRSILNFAPTVLSVPKGADVRRVDLAVELQILAFHEQRRNDLADDLAAAELVADLHGPEVASA